MKNFIFKNQSELMNFTLKYKMKPRLATLLPQPSAGWSATEGSTPSVVLIGFGLG